MWNLSGDDVEQAKEQLKGRRAAIKARYDDEMKRVDDELSALEKFESAAVEFMSQYKGEEEASEPVVETELAVEESAAITEPATEENDPIGAHSPVEEPVEARVKAPAEAAAEQTGSSRWRLRLNGSSATEAA